MVDLPILMWNLIFGVWTLLNPSGTPASSAQQSVDITKSFLLNSPAHMLSQAVLAAIRAEYRVSRGYTSLGRMTALTLTFISVILAKMEFKV